MRRPGGIVREALFIFLAPFCAGLYERAPGYLPANFCEFAKKSPVALHLLSFILLCSMHKWGKYRERPRAAPAVSEVQRENRISSCLAHSSTTLVFLSSIYLIKSDFFERELGFSSISLASTVLFFIINLVSVACSYSLLYQSSVMLDDAVAGYQRR